jgi:hypothetical protein
MAENQRHLPPPRVLTAADLARMLDIGVRQARRLLQRRRLPGAKLSGRWYASREAVVGRIEDLSDAQSAGIEP